MRRTTKAMLSLGAILLYLFGVMACQEVGPGKSGRKYVGQYIKKTTNSYSFGDSVEINILEIKRDKTYRWETKWEYIRKSKWWIISEPEPQIETGTWEIEREKEREVIILYPDEAPGIPRFAFVKKDNTLVDAFGRGTFVKQTAAVQKTRKETKDKPKVAKSPKIPIPQKDNLATYTSEKGFFLELRRDNTYFLGRAGKWKITTRKLNYPYEDEVEYKIILNVVRESGSGYLEGDTITGLEDLDLVKHERAKPIEEGYGKLWSTYVDPEEGVLVEFKEDGTFLEGAFGKWKRKGDTLRLYLEGEEKPPKLRIKGKTILLPDSDILVKQK